MSGRDCPVEPDARTVLDELVVDAGRRRASDVHLEPRAADYAVRFRVDGMLETIAAVPVGLGRRLVNRLMVLAGLLTYRTDVPQEGTLTVPGPDGAALELRVAVIPTHHGLRAALRLPADLAGPRDLDGLGLPAPVREGLEAFAGAGDGMLVLTGPAGSGKTTTTGALLEHIVATSPGVCAVSLEDPVERDLPGVTQIEVRPFGELTYERALRSILRQDPQVLAIGEIRDAATGALAVQAALSGHRLVTTLHAATAGGAVARLLQMGLEPYRVAGGLRGVVAMRLVRRRAGAGYAGRVPVASYAAIDGPARRAILAGADADAVDAALAAGRGHVDLHGAAGRLVEAGLTDAAEVRRVLGKRRDSLADRGDGSLAGDEAVYSTSGAGVGFANPAF